MRVINFAYMIGMMLGLLFLVSCMPKSYQQQYQEAAKKNCDVIQDISRSKKISANTANAIKTNFYSSNVYHSGGSPAWLNNPVSLRASNMPLELALNKILPQNSISVQFDIGADRNRLISLNYSGSVSGALDKIAANTGYAYTIEDNMITFSPYVTKTFDVSFMPGTSQYMVGQKQGDSMLSTNNSSNNTASGVQNDSQFSSLEGNLSVWKDLKEAVTGMLSAEGKVMVSESTTTITVRDRPQNVQAVSDYLASMNRDLSREVLLKVRVLQVSLNKDFNYGIDWNLAYESAAKLGFSTGDLSQVVNQSPLGASQPFGPSGQIGKLVGPSGLSTNGSLGIPGISAGIASGPFQNTQILINALSQQGAVSNITNPEVVTLNNQVAQIDISRQTTYLASSTTTVTAGAAPGFAQTSLNPGVISTGFKLYILPKILNGNIYLEISSELSKLESLQTLTPPGGSSSIQLPTVDGKHFNLRSMVPTKSTLIVAGFNSVDTVAGNNSSFGLFGGKGAGQQNTETVLLITPTILSGNTGNRG